MDHPTNEVLSISMWQSNDGRDHFIPNMEASHCINCMNLLAAKLGDDRFIYEMFYVTRRPIREAPFNDLVFKTHAFKKTPMKHRHLMDRRFLTMKRFEWELHVRTLAKTQPLSLD